MPIRSPHYTLMSIIIKILTFWMMVVIIAADPTFHGLTT